MSCEDYIVGQRPRFDFQIRDAGVLVDPTTLNFAFEKPDATVTTYVYGTDAELVKDATGKYHVELTLDQSGWWSWRQESTGVVTATQGKFRVGAELIA
jgi:hypothetical protein